MATGLTTFDKRKLTKSAVDGLSEPGIYPDSILTGFRVLVSVDSRTGKLTKTYQMRSRVKGEKNPVTVTIGAHKDPAHAEGKTEAVARSEAEESRRQMKNGINPNEAFRLEKQRELIERAEVSIREKAEGLTLETLFADWKASYRGADGTVSLYTDVLHAHLGSWLKKAVIEIRVEDIRKRYLEIAKVTPSSANNTFRALRLLINWAIEEYSDDQGRQVFTFNPVTKALKNHWVDLPPRDDIIRIDDLKAWFDAVESVSNTAYRDCFILMLLTGLRKSEAASLDWHNVDFGAKQLTVVDTKNGRKHSLPFTTYIKKMLEDRLVNKQSDYVFPGYGGADHIKDVRYYQEQITEESGVSFTPHTLRRTFATTAGRLVPSYMVKALLNHFDKADVTQTHYQAHRVEEMRQPLQLVEDAILVSAGRKKRNSSRRR